MSAKSKPNIFSSTFLECARIRETPSIASGGTAWAGPWSVDRRGEEFAVIREDQEKPEAVTAFEDIALLLAAIFPIVGKDPLYCLEREVTDDGRQVVLKTILGDEGYTTVGRLRSADDNLAKVLSVAEYLVRCPRSLALLLEAAPYEALELAGVALARRFAQGQAVRKGSRRVDPGAEAETEPTGAQDEKETP